MKADMERTLQISVCPYGSLGSQRVWNPGPASPAALGVGWGLGSAQQCLQSLSTVETPAQPL